MKRMQRDNRQVLMDVEPDEVIVARTPSESGLTFEEFYLSIKHLYDNVKGMDKRTIIFEDADGKTSWTVGEVAYDKTWLRFR